MTYVEDLVLQLEKRNDELANQQMFLQSVFEFASELLGKTSLEEIAWLVTQKLISQFGLEDCVIYVVKDGYCHQISAYGPKQKDDHQVLAPIIIKVGEGIVGTVAQTGVPEIIDDTRNDSRYIVDDRARLSELCVPIFSESEVIGVIDTENSKLNFFSETHLHTISTIANLISIALKNAMALENEKIHCDFLKSRNEKLNVLLRQTSEPVIFTDHEDKIIEWNANMVRLSGIYADEALGSTMTDLSKKYHWIQESEDRILLEMQNEDGQNGTWMAEPTRTQSRLQPFTCYIFRKS